jgi:hypothetical protein
MSNKIITVHFTSVGVPCIGLTPTIYIYELDATDPTINTLIISGGTTHEIGQGWYRYEFTSYNLTKNYVYTFDGGSVLSVGDRYKIGGNESYIEDISSGVWDEPLASHLISGSSGFTLTQVKSDSSSLMISQVAITSLVNTMLKYERNRTKINTTNSTLTIYDDDGTTPLTIFQLKDHLGQPSISEICERLPG